MIAKDIVITDRCHPHDSTSCVKCIRITTIFFVRLDTINILHEKHDSVLLY